MIVAQAGLGTAFLRSLLLPLVFLAPGVPALRLKRWAARRSGRPPRFQLIVYGTLLSGASLVTLYFGVSWLNWKLVTVKMVNCLSLFEGLLLFVAHLGLTCVYGILTGEAQYNYRTGNRPRDLYDSWDFAFEKVYQGGDVVLKTTRGTWIRGRVVQNGSSEEKQDLLFESAGVVAPETDESVAVIAGEDSRPELQYEKSGRLRSGKSVKEFSDMNEVVDNGEDVQRKADNYVYIDKSNIETVVFCGGTEMDPESEIGAGTPGAAQELLGALVQWTFEPPNLPQNPLRGYGWVLLPMTLASAVIALGVVPAQFRLSSLETVQFSSLVGVVAASVTTLYGQTERFRRPKCVMNVDIGAHRTLYGFGAVAVIGSYSSVLFFEIVPLFVGTVVGVTITTVHLGLSKRFDLSTALCSLILASTPILVSFVWVNTAMSSQFGRPVSLLWVATAAVLAINRLCIGTPSSYDGWSDVARYTVWWVVTVAVSVGLVAVAFGANVPAVRVVTGVLLIVGWLLARRLRQTVQTDMS